MTKMKINFGYKLAVLNSFASAQKKRCFSIFFFFRHFFPPFFFSIFFFDFFFLTFFLLDSDCTRSPQEFNFLKKIKVRSIKIIENSSTYSEVILSYYNSCWLSMKTKARKRKKEFPKRFRFHFQFFLFGASFFPFFVGFFFFFFFVGTFHFLCNRQNQKSKTLYNSSITISYIPFDAVFVFSK